jgi:Papain family cysteine protease
MKNTIFILGLWALPSFAATYEAVNSSYHFQDVPEFQAILRELNSRGEFTVKEMKVPTPKTLSRGEQLVEEAKARNRAKLAQMYKSQKDKVEDSRSVLEKWKDEEKNTLGAWKNESRDKLNEWKREQEIFLGRLKVYKENTFEMPVRKEKIIEKKIPAEAIPDVHIVNEAFSISIKDQFNRPTCVAFAGIRALEILLAQNKMNQDLSEQYLYWAGKPNCQKNPCREKGSWIRESYSFSNQHPSIDIPLEKNCSYKTDSIDQNETQIPLHSSCSEGSVKVDAFQDVRTISEVVEIIKKDRPVVVAARLSENFYRNKGLVTLAESESTGKKMNSHSFGHAFLAVGVMELPENLKAREGNFCLVIANSWGKGWGSGGYACITEKWFEKYRQPSLFIAPVKIAVKENAVSVPKKEL